MGFFLIVLSMLYSYRLQKILSQKRKKNTNKIEEFWDISFLFFGISIFPRYRKLSLKKTILARE